MPKEINVNLTKEQRKIIGDRLDVVSFSTDALANSYIEELSLLENVLETEITLLHGYFMFLHQNKELDVCKKVQSFYSSRRFFLKKQKRSCPFY